VSEQGPPDPGQLPPTHRPYGDREDNPFTSPSGPAAQDSGPKYAAPAQQPPAYQPYAPAGPQPPYGPPQPPVYGYGGPVLPDHPQAQTAFVVGLVALVGGFFCALPIFVGPWAWVVGARARKEIDAAPGRYGGREKATAGMVMGIVATALLGLVLAVVGVAIIVIVAAAA
jgi:hypothetical protein